MRMDSRTFFEQRVSLATPRIRRALSADVVVVFHLEGPDGGSWQLTVCEDPIIGPVGPGPKDCVVQCSSEDFMAILHNTLNPMDAFQTGRLQVSGDIGLLIKLRRMFLTAL